MTDFSPLIRRTVAVGILVFLLLGTLNLLVLPVIGQMSASLSELADARFRLKRVEAIRARPAPARGQQVSKRLYLIAPNVEAATNAVTTSINAAAGVNGVQISDLAQAPPDAERGQALAFTVAGTGRQEALLTFINQLEQGSPSIRFSTWRLASEQAVDPSQAASAQMQLVFSGTATVVWRPVQ